MNNPFPSFQPDPWKHPTFPVESKTRVIIALAGDAGSLKQTFKQNSQRRCRDLHSTLDLGCQIPMAAGLRWSGWPGAMSTLGLWPLSTHSCERERPWPSLGNSCGKECNPRLEGKPEPHPRKLWDCILFRSSISGFARVGLTRIFCSVISA